MAVLLRLREWNLLLLAAPDGLAAVRLRVLAPTSRCTDAGEARKNSVGFKEALERTLSVIDNAGATCTDRLFETGLL